MPELKEVFEMTTKQIEPDIDAWREQEERQRRSTWNRKIGAIAVAVMLGVATLVLIFGTRVGRDTAIPADQPTTRSPTPVDVARGFVDAYGAFNVDRALTYLTNDADISGLMLGSTSVEAIDEQLRLNLSMLEANRYEQLLGTCETTGSFDSGTIVRCTYDFHFFGSDQLGRGPFTGSFFDLTIRGGEVVEALQSWEIEKFSPRMWEPFATWVSTNHPDDVAVMYEDESQSSQRLTEESIQLWERRVREYVEKGGQ